jgi:hypothetical protein
VDQWRRERVHQGRAEDAVFDLAVVGGSVSEVFASQGFTRLRELLEADARFAGRELRLSCWGRGGFKAPQTGNQIAWLIDNGTTPDAVVLIDGFNEVAIGMQNAVLGVDPLLPSAMHWAALVQGGGFDRAVVDLFIGARVEQRAVERLSDTALGGGLFRSALLQYLFARRMQAHLGGMRARFDEISRALTERVEGEVLSGSRLDLAPLSAMQGIVRAWAENSRTLAGLCRERGIAYLHLLQPTLHDPGAKPMSEEEERDCGIGPAWGRGVLEGYPLLRATGAELAARGVPFCDTSRIFADVRETLYFDSCHFGPEGNALFAESIASALLERLPAELEEPSTLDHLFGGDGLPLTRWTTAGEPRRRRVQGVSVYLCVPDAELAFALPDDVRHVSARYGMLRKTHALSDGVRFVALLEDGDTTTTLLERSLDPGHVPADRGLQDFSAELPAHLPGGTGRTLVLRTENEPGKSDKADGAFWSTVDAR